jgi:hypothetical protein
VFAGVIAYFSVTGGVTIRRGSAGSSSKGRYTPGATSDTTGVVASVQPIKGDELERLPEGIRTKRPAKLYTETELKQKDTAAGTPPDLIIWDGETWEVESVEKHAWGTYYKALIVRQGQ